MAASTAITAAEPSGLWGILKESFARGTELAKAKMDPGTDALITAVVNDFRTAEGRSVTRDGLNAKLKGGKTRKSASRSCGKPQIAVHWASLRSASPGCCGRFLSERKHRRRTHARLFHDRAPRARADGAHCRAFDGERNYRVAGFV
jgi:hypothetical protein